MFNKNWIISLVAIVISVVALFSSFLKQESFGSLPGPIHNTVEFFTKGLVNGGSILSFSGSASTTPAQFCDNSVWDVTPTASTSLVTLPTATGLAAYCLPTKGDSYKLFIRNKATGDAHFRLYGDTGNTVYTPTSSDAIIEEGERAEVTIYNVGSGAVSSLIETYK